MKLLLFLLLLPILITGQVTTTKFFIEGKYPGVLYKPSTWDAAKKYTLVFFFHGKDEKGDGTDASLTQLEPVSKCREIWIHSSCAAARCIAAELAIGVDAGIYAQVL
jgi:hypothetical protein